MNTHSRQCNLNSQLRELLRERGFAEGSQLPAERELAQMLGVGRTALRPVLLAFEEEGFIVRRAGAGTFLVKMPVPRVAGAQITLIAPYAEVPSEASGAEQGRQPEEREWVHRVASALEKALLGSGARFQLLDQAPRATDACSVKEMAREAAHGGADAVVFLHPLGTRETIACALALLYDRGVHPLIVSARTYSGLASQVYFDSGWGAYRATRHLLELGHTRIAFAGASAGHEWVQERLQGYQQALGASDAPRKAEWVWMPRDGERWPAPADGIAAFDKWQQLPAESRPTAVVAANDIVALGFLDAARQRGVNVPGAVSLVGFDNQPDALVQGLTTIERPSEALGEAAALVTLERLRAGETGDKTATVTHRLRPLLLERRTTAPLKIA